MIHKIEIQFYGTFEIKNDFLHRPISRLVTKDKGQFKTVQFDSYIENIEAHYPQRSPFQKGYNANGQEIRIRVIN